MRLCFVALLMGSIMSTSAITRNWTGDASANWSNPDNWNPVGVPQNNDILSFSGGSAIRLFNDIPDLIVTELNFGPFGTYEVSGNPIQVRNHIRVTDGLGNVESRCYITFNCEVVLLNNATFFARSISGYPSELYFNANIDLNGFNLDISVASPDSYIKINGTISGHGNVTAITTNYDAAAYEYIHNIEFGGSANSTFDGTLYIGGNQANKGKVYLNKDAGVLVTNRVEIRYGNELIWRNNSDQIGNLATVVIGSGGKMSLNGYNETIGSLILTNASADTSSSLVDTVGRLGSIYPLGTLTINQNIVSGSENAIFSPTILGRINLPAGHHSFLLQGSMYVGLQFNGEIAGLGGFTKLGESALLLLASNSFVGPVIAANGIIDVRHANALGSASGSTTLGAGGVTLRNVAVVGEPLIASGLGTGGELPGSVLTSIGSNSWSGPVTLNTNLVVVSGDMAFTGPISGTGGLGCFSGGTMRLGGTLSNTFTGTLLVRCPLLELAKTPGANAYSGPLVVGGGFGGPVEARWLGDRQSEVNLTVNNYMRLYPNGTINFNNHREDVYSLEFNGGIITNAQLGIYDLVTVNSNNTQAVISGDVFFINYDDHDFVSFQVADGSSYPDLLVNAVLHGGSTYEAFSKDGAGQMALTSASEYPGNTDVRDGILIVQNAGALGTRIFTSTSVFSGATLAFNSIDGPVDEIIHLLGGGLLNVSGTVLLRNQLPSSYPAIGVFGGIGDYGPTIRVESGGRLTLDGFVSGAGQLTKTGPGSLVFSNSSPNTYTGDTIIQEGTLELRKPASVIAVPGNMILGPASVGSPATARWFQTGGVNASSNITVNANSSLDLNGNAQNVNRLNLNDGGDVQTGAGKMTFLTGGPITVGSLNPGGSQASSSFSGSIGLPANGTLSFVVNQYALGTFGVSGPELDVSAAIPAPVENTLFERAGLFKSGGGGLRLTGNNGFNGRVDVSAGGIIAGSATALGSSFEATYVTGGASLALINGITISGESLFLNSTNSAALDNLGGDNTWTGPITLARASTIGVNTDWSLLLSGVVSGPGTLTKVGAGTLTLSGGANNTHAGNTFVNAGTLALNKVYGFQAVPASLVIGQSGGGPATLVRYLNHDQVWQNITVNPSGLLNLNNFDEYASDVTLNGGGDVQTGTGSLYVLGTNGLTVNPANENPATITGRLGFDAGSRTITVAAGTTIPEAHDLDISAVIFQANPTVNLTKAGAGRARFGGTNTYTGTTTVSGGQLQIDGSQPQSPVLVNGARLQGIGVIGAVTFNGSTANRVAPGRTAGILTTSNFNATAVGGGALEMDLNGAVAGISYDQLNVRGSVNLTGLSLQPTLNFTSAATQPFTLINNDASDAVTGTFTGLPQNKKFYLGGELFQISYTGGTGNDVVLTRLVTPPPPVLKIERATTNSVRLTWATNDPPFSLQSNTNLTGSNWIAATPLPTLSSTNHIVTNTITGNAKFYRLINP